MKKLFIGISAVLFMAFVVSCDGPKKSTEKQAVSSPDESAAQKDDAPNASDLANPDDRPQAIEAQDGTDLTGTRVVENSVSRLVSKLKLTGSQPGDLKAILTKTFEDNGNKLESMYSVEQSRTISRDLYKMSTEAIMAILTDEQKTAFQKLGQH